VLLTDYGYLQEEEKKREVFGFVTGNKYLDLSDDHKMSYIIGLLDMCSYLTSTLAPEYYLDFTGKIEDITGRQIRAVFDKYLEEHPEQWHFVAAGIFYRAMADL